MSQSRRTETDRVLMADVGRRLKWVREALDMTQLGIATAVGLDQTAWSLYELGKRWPDIGTATRIISKLKISYAYLIEGSLEGVERELAIRLAAHHPELVPPISKEHHTDRARA